MPYVADPDKIKANIRRQLGALKERYHDSPELIQDINEIGTNLVNSVEEETETIYLDNLTRQRFLYFLGGYLVIHDERRAWFLYHAIALCLSIDEVTELVKKKFGTRYNEFRTRFSTYGSILNKVKYHFDHMEDKTLKDGDIDSQAYRTTMDWLTKLPLIYQELDTVFVLICRYTDLGQKTMPTPDIAIFQQQYKRVDYKESRRELRDGLDNSDERA